ncbi:MAG: hypothetical protein GX785_07600 [Armatimonadetes bacterium]|nr:hypothetical protein [Armatimonadota bacterium]
MHRERESGQSLVLLAVALSTLLGFMALTVDVGHWFVARQRAVNVCDMAALAGAQDLSLTVDAASARRVQSVVLSIVNANNAEGFAISMSQVLGPDNPDIIISEFNDTVATNSALDSNIVWTDSQGNVVPRPGPGRGILVRGQIPVQPLFARIFGITGAKVIPAQTAVALGTVSTITGNLVPFGVSVHGIVDIESSPSATIEQQLTYRSWKDSWTGTPGAFGTLGLTHTSGTTLREEIQWGHFGTYGVGQYVAMTSGNKTGPIQQGTDGRIARSQYATIDEWLAAFHSDDPVAHQEALQDSRVVLIPIVDETQIIGESVRIVGFATYAIAEWRNGEKKVYGYFVKSTYQGSVGEGLAGFGTRSYYLL